MKKLILSAVTVATLAGSAFAEDRQMFGSKELSEGNSVVSKIITCENGRDGFSVVISNSSIDKTVTYSSCDEDSKIKVVGASGEAEDEEVTMKGLSHMAIMYAETSYDNKTEFVLAADSNFNELMGVTNPNYEVLAVKNKATGEEIGSIEVTEFTSRVIINSESKYDELLINGKAFQFEADSDASLILKF